MAHELSLNMLGEAEMAYCGAKPWHGLGQEVCEGASLDEWMDQARMNWRILRAPVQYTNANLHDFPEHHVLYRSDNDLPLSVVSPRYKIVQPKKMSSSTARLSSARALPSRPSAVSRAVVAYGRWRAPTSKTTCSAATGSRPTSC